MSAAPANSSFPRAALPLPGLPCPGLTSFAPFWGSILFLAGAAVPMYKMRFALLLFLFACFCHSLFAEDDRNKEYIAGQNQFCWHLLQVLDPGLQNICFSSYNISNTCALAYVGAEGKTKTEMQKALCYPPQSDDLFCREVRQLELFLAPVLKSAEAIAIDRSFLPTDNYLMLVQNRLGADLFEANFAKDPAAAVMNINNWVKNRTEGRITSLLEKPDVNPLTKMILLGACFCKTAWRSPFDPNKTKEGLFHTPEGKDVSVPMMHRLGPMLSFQNEELSVVWLDCKTEKESIAGLQAVIILPQDEKSSTHIWQNLSSFILDGWKQQATQDPVELTVPKCRLQQKVELNKALQALGMQAAFSRDANFSPISPTMPLQIEKVIHEAFLELGEAGITAGAATAISMVMTAVGPSGKSPRVINCDHPFLLLLQEKTTGLLLFAGFVAYPQVATGAF